MFCKSVFHQIRVKRVSLSRESNIRINNILPISLIIIDILKKHRPEIVARGFLTHLNIGLLVSRSFYGFIFVRPYIRVSAFNFSSKMVQFLSIFEGSVGYMTVAKWRSQISLEYMYLFIYSFFVADIITDKTLCLLNFPASTSTTCSRVNINILQNIQIKLKVRNREEEN